MVRTFLSIIFLLAWSAMVTAQTPTGESSKAGSNEKSGTLTGCLSGPNDQGAYVLKSAHGPVEVGGSDELKQHVGHQVKLSGTWASSGSQVGEREEENEKSSANAKHEEAESAERHEKGEASERHFKVSNVTMVSDTCSATGKK